MAISTPMLVTFIVYIFGMVLIGFIAWRSTKNFDDYILGGRSLGPFVTALSAGASDMSGWLLMGLPGAIFLSGISESWIAIGLTLGAWINWKLVAGRLRVHTEVNNNALTLPDYFTGRFEDKSRVLRIISALVILLFFTIYCASGIVAGARLFESTFGMSYETALWAGAAATIIYTFVGGFLAVSWTDTVQASLMIFALILTPVIVIISVGGFGDSLEVIKQKSIEEGMRANIRVAVQYIEAWISGNGCVPIYGLMEDAATAEISRTSIWQWIHHQKTLSNGKPVTKALFRQMLGEEMKVIASELGEERFSHGRFDDAARLMEQITTSDELIDFLTLPGYRLLA